MRIVIDLQGAQGDSRFRGIGRYSLDLALGIARNRGEHEVIIALSDLFPDSINDLRSAFFGVLPSSAIRVWTAPGPVSWIDQENSARRKQAEMVRETFLASLEPDVVLVASLFEGFGDNVITSIGLQGDIPTSVVLYDLIPLIRADTLGNHKNQPSWYKDKIEHIKRADQLLAISASSASEAIEHLQWSSGNVANISAAANPMFKQCAAPEQETKKLKSKYGLTQKFLMCAAGMDPNKNLHAVIRAFSRLKQETIDTHQLAVVCRIAPAHRKKLADFVASTGLASDSVILTDFVPDDELIQLYNACTAFIVPSLHEGFGLPALEAMQCGKAVIASNTTSLPEVIGREDALFDPVDEQAIAEKIEKVLTNDEFRHELEAHGVKQAKKFSWDLTAKRAVSSLAELVLSKNKADSPALERDATLKPKQKPPFPTEQTGMTGDLSEMLPESEVLEEKHGQTRFSQDLRDVIENAHTPPRAYIQELAEILGSRLISNDELKLLAEALSQNFPSESRKPNLFVDVSVLAQSDAKTGIQRVVRAVLSALLKIPDAHYTFVPVRRNSTGRYVIAVNVAQVILGVDLSDFSEMPVDPAVGDIFLGLDLDGDCPPDACLELKRMKRWGAKIFHVVYDLLPLQFPSYFDAGTAIWYPKWIERVASFDGAICISKAVADDLRKWVDEHGPDRKTPFDISWFHLGADVENSTPSRGVSDDNRSTLELLERRPSFLMVGTVEPRKGHQQVMLAFEQLWAKGIDANLAIVGKAGWNVASLTKSLRKHPEKGSRLFWLESASDEFLEKIYYTCNCLIAASEGEGFGLPLIEAAQHKLPILARDIPVFREVAGKYATYFSGREPDDVSKAVERWLHDRNASNHVLSDDMPWITWDQSAARLMSIIDKLTSDGHEVGR